MDYKLNLEKKPCVVCVTGQMAAGKNYICEKITAQNPDFVSIDADKTAHEAISLCENEIFKSFETEAKNAGINLKNADGTLSRKSLGKLIFPRQDLLKKQESIVYPKLTELIVNYIEENKAKGRSVIINAAVLYKTPELLFLCSKIIFVSAPFFTRLKRALKRDNLPIRQILARFKSQKNLLEKYKKSGIPIEILQNK